MQFLVRLFFSFRLFDLQADTEVKLGPTTPYSSVEHGKFAYVGYTGVFNILDYPAVSFPSGVKVDKALDTPYAAHQALSDIDATVQNICKSSCHLYSTLENIQKLSTHSS